MAEKRSGLPVQSITLLIAAVGVAIGLWQYRDTNSEQYKKEIWSAQKALFEDAITAATNIANGDNLDSVAYWRRRFWNLYWGNLAMLESQNVESAMVRFGGILGACEQNNNPNAPNCFKPVPGNSRTDLQLAALNLAHCARDTLRTTWERADIGPLTEKCQVGPATTN